MTALKKYDDLPKELNDLTGEIFDCFLHVHKELGPGYQEKMYEDACLYEFKLRGLACDQQKQFKVLYKGVELPSTFQPDLIVENRVIIELKAVEKIHPLHQAQIYAYLKGTGLPIGFLANFNVSLIKNGVSRYVNKFSESPDLRVEKE